MSEAEFRQVIKDHLGAFDFRGKKVFEFGPCVKEDRLGILKIASKLGASCHTMDICTTYGQTPEEARTLCRKYGISLEIADYTSALRDERCSTEYKLLKSNFYDLVFARGCPAASPNQLGDMLRLCTHISKKDGKIILIPWVNDPAISGEHYQRMYDEFDFTKYGYTMRQVDHHGYNYPMKIPTVVVTKNVCLGFGG